MALRARDSVCAACRDGRCGKGSGSQRRSRARVGPRRLGRPVRLPLTPASRLEAAQFALLQERDSDEVAGPAGVQLYLLAQVAHVHAQRLRVLDPFGSPHLLVVTQKMILEQVWGPE